MGKKANKELRNNPKHSYGEPEDIAQLKSDFGLTQKSKFRRRRVKRLSDVDRDREVEEYRKFNGNARVATSFKPYRSNPMI